MANKTSYNFIKVDCDPDSYIECWIAYYIWRTVPFLFISLGTCGNLLNIVVLSRKRIRKYSTSVYLLFLSGSDLVVLWSGAALDTNESIKGTLITETSAFMCRSARFIPIASAGYSAWLIVLLTFERIILSKFFQSVTINMTPKIAITASTTTLAIIVLFTAHLIFGFHFEELEIPTLTNSSMKHVPSYSKCSLNSGYYKKFYYDIWPPLILLFLNVIPIICILCGNVIIGAQVFKQRNNIRRIFPTVRTEVRTRRIKSASKMLILVSGIFLVTTLPYTTYLVFKSQLHNLDDRAIARHQLITAVILMLLYSNFTFNFLLYFVSGTLFKQEWQILITEICDRVARVIQRTRPRQTSEVIHLRNID